MGKWLTAHLVHRLLWVLVFSVSDMLICLFQTEHSHKAGLATTYGITNKWKKRRLQRQLLFLCVLESVTLFNAKGRAAASGPWSFTFINEALSIGRAWHCAQLSRYRGQISAQATERCVRRATEGVEECSSRGNSTREGPGVAEHMACQRNCSNSVPWKQRAAGGMRSDEAGGMGKGTRLLSPDSGLCHPVPGRSRDVGPVNSAVWEFTEQNQFFLPPSSWLQSFLHSLHVSREPCSLT